MQKAQELVVPESGKVAVWEAEKALMAGWQVVPHNGASGGAFVEPVADHPKPVLEFRFKVDKPTTIKVFPLWWRHGEQKTATRFPSQVPYLRIQQMFEMAYPDPKGITRLPFAIPARFGPDALDGDGERLFFTAPETGRIGIVDLLMERIVDSIEVGGYLTDLVFDHNLHRLFIADGMSNRIVVLDTQRRTKIAEVAVPEMPYSLALHNGHLFVACMMAKKVVVLETKTLRKVHEIALPLPPQHAEVRNGQLLVWLVPAAYDAKTLTETVPDRLAFYPQHVFPEGAYEPPCVWQTLRALQKGGIVRLFHRVSSFGSLWDGRFHVEPQAAIVRAGEKPIQLRIRWTLNPSQPHEEVLDIATLVGEMNDQEALPDRYCVADGKFFFTLPSLGKVVCRPLEPDTKPVLLDIGGYLTDMAAFSDGFWVGYRGFGAMSGQPLSKGEPFGVPMGKYVDVCLSFFPSPDIGRVYSPDSNRYPAKVYIADSQNNRIIVVDPQTLRVVKSVPVGTMPIALNLFGSDLFVTCRKGQEVLVIDVRTDEIVRRCHLPAEPVFADVARFQPPHTASEFRPPAEIDNAPVWYVAHFHPLAFRLNDYQPTQADELTLVDAILYRRRQRFVWTDAQGREHQAFADNMHTIRFDGERWLDVSEVTDPKRQIEPAQLRWGDELGTITIAVDGSVAHDWMRNIWLTPNERRFLVNPPQHLWQQGVEPFGDFASIFREWNAPAFTVGAGEHGLTVTAHSPYACLDGLIIWRTLERTVQVQLVGATDDTVNGVLLPASVFASDEPVQFRLRFQAQRAQRLHCQWQVLHPVDGEVASGELTLDAPAGKKREALITPPLHRMGLLTLRVQLQSDDGTLVLERVFVRLPKLTHPRLLCRPEALPNIHERIAQHRELFRRWRSWLEQHINEADFLPKDWTSTGQNLGVELAKWRAIACLFAEWAMPRTDGQKPLLQKLLPLLKGRASAGGWSSFQADFQFGGALAVLYDFATAIDQTFAPMVKAQLQPALLLERALPETLMLIDEPLTPKMRMVLSRHAIMLDNYLRYFAAHQGKTGGMLWQGLGSHCQCALHSIARSLLFWGNFLGDLSFVRDVFGKLYTHLNYALPKFDHDGFLAKGGLRGDHPGTPGIDPKIGTLPMRWLLVHLTGNQMERSLHDLRPLIERLELATEEEAMQLLNEGANFAAPLLLALGIYEMDGRKDAGQRTQRNGTKDEKRGAEQTEPLSLCFEGEGAVCLKSDWSPTMTDIYFVSGVRDVGYRTQPNHLQIFKAGRVLFGTPVHVVDHGTPTPSWANAIVIGEGLPKEWAIAMGYARMDERRIVNRFAPEVLSYALRDFRRTGIEPESYRGWFAGGHAGPGTYDLPLHSHTRHPFIAQGAIVAFVTHPAFDYIAGDATNVWRVEEVREVYRQVVFVLPDVIIVFDRIKLRQLRPTQWLASTAPEVHIDGQKFLIINSDAFLQGVVLLPERAHIEALGVQSFEGGRKQNRLRITPDAPSLSVNYLVVSRTGAREPTPLDAELVTEGEMVGAKVRIDGQTVTALFRLNGDVGGEMRLEQDGREQRHRFPANTLRR